MKNNTNSMSTGGGRGNHPYNVLVMADYRTPCSGNFVASILELAEAMRKIGNEVCFLFPESRNGGGYSWSRWLEDCGFSVTLLSDQTPEEQVLTVLSDLIREHDIQIVHTHFGLYPGLLLGWDKYRKGMDIAVKAVAEFRKTDPTLHLGIIGVGCPPWQSTVDWIREQTGVDPSCGWLHFLNSYEDMFVCHRAVDVYLSASRKEAFSYGLLEAISQNTPVVVSDIEGTQWAGAYTKASMYPVEDVNACAEALRSALALGREPSNYEEITARYGIDLWCKRIMEIYTNMLT